MKLKVRNLLPSNDESYNDYMIRMEGVYNKKNEARDYERQLEQMIIKIKSFGYNVIIMGNKVKLTIKPDE